MTTASFCHRTEDYTLYRVWTKGVDIGGETALDRIYAMTSHLKKERP